MKNLHILIIVSVLICSCEKSIDYQLKTQISETVLIMFPMADSLLKVHVSNSTDILSTEKYKSGSNSLLSVKINNKDEIQYNYPENNQWFQLSNYKPKAGDVIKTKLKIINSGKELLGATTIPSAVKIEKIDTITLIEADNDKEDIEVLKCYIKINDPKKEKNFYQIQVEYLVKEKEEFIIKEKRQNLEFAKDDKIFLANEHESVFFNNVNYKGTFDDYFFDGRGYWLRISLPRKNIFKKEDFVLSKKVIFKLYSLSEDYYRYLRSSSEQKAYRKDPLYTTKNVYSNIENGLGVVAGLNVCTDTLIIYEYD